MREGWGIEKWVRKHVWFGRKRRIGISIWHKSDHKCHLPLYEYTGRHEWSVRLPGTRWCLSSYERGR